MKRILSVLLIVIVALEASAQSVNEKKGVIYNKELSFGISLHTSGWGIFMDKANRKSLVRKNFWQIEFTQLHHSKEVKQSLDPGYSFFGWNSPKPFIYGKQNSFYLFNTAIGQQRLIGHKAEKSGVEVGFKYSGGISLGVIKPYYLELIYPVDNSTQPKILAKNYTPETAEKFLDWSSIYGGAGFAYGLGEVRFIPGLHTQAGLNFDWATYDDFVKSLEAGIRLDVYYKEIPIMISEKNSFFYPNLYVSLQFGKKW